MLKIVGNAFYLKNSPLDNFQRVVLTKCRNPWIMEYSFVLYLYVKYTFFPSVCDLNDRKHLCK